MLSPAHPWEMACGGEEEMSSGMSHGNGCRPRVLLLPSPHHTVRVCTPVPEEVGLQRGQAEIPKSSLSSS